MIEQRFTVFRDEHHNSKGIYDNITQRKIVRWGPIVRLLNGLNNRYIWRVTELKEENKQLKSDNNRLVNETAKIIAEHQRKVLDLIDDKIDELEGRYKFGQEVYRGCPMHNIRFGINVLKELKKELQE